MNEAMQKPIYYSALYYYPKMRGLGRAKLSPKTPTHILDCSAAPYNIENVHSAL
jgi:hypothetical protein